MEQINRIRAGFMVMPHQQLKCKRQRLFVCFNLVFYVMNVLAVHILVWLPPQNRNRRSKSIPSFSHVRSGSESNSHDSGL